MAQINVFRARNFIKKTYLIILFYLSNDHFCVWTSVLLELRIIHKKNKETLLHSQYKTMLNSSC